MSNSQIETRSKRSYTNAIEIPTIYKAKLSIYITNKFNIWTNFKERFLLIDKGILTILSTAHMKEKGMFHLAGMTLTNDSIDKSNYPSNLQLCLMPVDKSINYNLVFLDKSISNYLTNSTKNQPSYPIYLFFKSEDERQFAIGCITSHVLYSNKLYDVNTMEIFKHINNNITIDTNNCLSNSIPNNLSTNSCSNFTNNLSYNSTSDPPNQLCGYLLKKGHYITNWRMRYFILSNGVLSYYLSKEKDSYKGVNIKGSVHLYNYMLSLTIEPGLIYLSTDITQLPPNTQPYIFIITSTTNRTFPSILRDFLNPLINEETIQNYSVRRYNKLWAKAIYRHILYGRYLINVHKENLDQIESQLVSQYDNLLDNDCEELRDGSFDNFSYNSIDSKIDSKLDSTIEGNVDSKIDSKIASNYESNIDSKEVTITNGSSDINIKSKLSDNHSDSSSSIDSNDYEDTISRDQSVDIINNNIFIQ